MLFSKDSNRNLRKAYKEVHNPQTEKSQKEALNFIAQVAADSRSHSQKESLKALNFLSGIVFHFGAKDEGLIALEKIYQNIFIAQDPVIKVRSIFYLEWIALKWTPHESLFQEEKSVMRHSMARDGAKKTLSLTNEEPYKNPMPAAQSPALKASQYLFSLIFSKNALKASPKVQNTILTSLEIISKTSENPNARVYTMNQLFNIAFFKINSR